MPVSTLTDFHHWLLSDESHGHPFILLSLGRGGEFGTKCAASVAHHLNEFDEYADGGWIAITPEVVHAIAADPAQRRLLGVADPCKKCPPTSQCGLRKVLASLAHRGRIVFDHPEAVTAVGDNPRGFRAAVGLPNDEIDKYHMILHPTAFSVKRLGPLIGDSFLEWSAHPHHA